MAGNSRVRGVLRHKQMESEPKDKFEDLLVFGYACKLFRDDEKASSIDQGSHLIPLMGDDSIKIDRYDVRGTLVDLKPLDVPQGGYDRSGLTAEERRVEALCDEERYFALYKDEAEEAVIKEEEIKRLNQDLDEVTSDEKSYHQVPFSYSNDQHVTKSSTPEAPVKSIIGELGDAIYMPPPALDVPPDMVVPPTRKLARVIEKTASFISSQGTQMEIIVKAKQANNPMFQFLHFDSALHPFYRHVQAAIRNGTYVIPDEDDAAESAEKDPPEKVNDNTNGQSNESDSENDNYLHPSLQPKVPDEPTPSAPKTEETSSMFPPTDLRPLLDKTASYMAKKGRHLEAVVLSKGDARFAFLKEDHNFHPYYIHKFTIYSEMHRNQQSAIMPAALQVPTNTIKSSTTTNNGDPDVVRSDRRKRAALFLDNIRRQKIPVSNSVVENGTAEDDIDAKSESTSSSSVKKSKSRSPADIEIIDARRPRERSLSRSPSSSSRKLRRSRSRQRSRSLSSVRSTGRIRGRSRSRSVHRRPSPSPERKRRHRKKHRSRDRHRKEKKRRRSRERSSRNKRSRRHRSRSGSRSSSGSRSPVLSRSTSRSPLLKSRSPSEPRRSPISTAVRKLATEASKSSSETSSPLPAQLLTVQPTFSKIAEGIRAKVIAMIEKDTKK